MFSLGASIYHAGLSDFFVSSEYHEALETALESAETKEAVKGILKEFHEKSRDRQTPFSLEPHLVSQHLRKKTRWIFNIPPVF